ncbi:MAG TPA: tetratricopeptide repeat protein [Vicinamibacteria bacterium]
MRPSLIAGAVAFALYLPSVGGGFLYDDQRVVVDNRAIRDLHDLRTVLLSEPARPLLGLTWAVNFALSGLRPWSYHLVNVAIHAANAALVASLFLWMARRRGRPGPSGQATAAACLFAVSPMAVETVAYVSSRSTALAALFALATLRLAVDCLTRRAPGRLALALLCYAAALASKEEAASVPLFLLLLDYFFVAGGRFEEVVRRARTHAPFWVLPAAGLVARRLVTGAWLPPPALGHGRYLLTQAAVFPLYLLRAVVPLDPAFYRGHPAASWPPPPAVTVGILASFVLAAVAVKVRRSRPEVSLGILWLAAGLVPSSSVVPLKEMAVDHRAYLGSAGVDFGVGSLAWEAGGVRAVGVLTVLLAGRALHYEWVLADPMRAWADAVRRVPASAEAQRGLGEAYAARGDPRAEEALRRAVTLEPDDYRSWTNLGAFYVATGRMQEAESAMRAAAQLAPGDARVRDNLGIVLLGLGREDEAVAELEAAIDADRSLAQPRIDLAEVELRRGHAERARELLDQAAGLVIDPEDAAAILALRRQLPEPP